MRKLLVALLAAFACGCHRPTMVRDCVGCNDGSDICFRFAVSCSRDHSSSHYSCREDCRRAKDEKDEAQAQYFDCVTTEDCRRALKRLLRSGDPQRVEPQGGFGRLQSL